MVNIPSAIALQPGMHNNKFMHVKKDLFTKKQIITNLYLLCLLSHTNIRTYNTTLKSAILDVSLHQQACLPQQAPLAMHVINWKTLDQGIRGS